MNYAFNLLLWFLSLSKGMTKVEDYAATATWSIYCAIAVVRNIPVWGVYPYWYVQGTTAWEPGSKLPPVKGGWVKLQQQVKACPVVLTLNINLRQARKIDELLRKKKSFCVVKNYVFHHGPSAPADVVKYRKNHKDKGNLIFVSCEGATHPLVSQHLHATLYPLGVGMIRHDRGWKLFIQDLTPLYK